MSILSSTLSFIARWCFVLLVVYGFAALISTIVAAIVPDLPGAAVGSLLCPSMTTAAIQSGREGKYSSYYLLCQTADGTIVQSYRDSFQLIWASFFAIPVLLFGLHLTRSPAPRADQSTNSD
jgi:hypothetical protein